MKRAVKLLMIVLLLVIAPASGGISDGWLQLGITQAHAQEQPQRKTLLELLFGGALQRQNERRQQVTAPTTAKRVRVQPAGSAATSASAAPSAPEPEVAAKNEDASKILVIGDFMASHLSEGLTEMFADNPAVVIVDRAVSLSGMVRNDVHDWPRTAASIIEEVKPIAVVVLVGMNDRQLISASSGRLQKLTGPWRTEYNARIDALARAVREKGMPLIWVGLPPVSKGTMNTDYLIFNELYRSVASTYGGTFVDVWEGFMTSEGEYSRSGPDINGQIVALRRSDGINMTRSGKVKLAFYAEKGIKRLTGFGKDALLSSLGPLTDTGFSEQPEYDPVASGKTIVVALGSPAADGGVVLEGESGFLTATDARRSNSFDLVASGLAAQPREGRVDSGWGKPSFDLARTEIAEPVLANMRGTSYRSVFDPLPVIPSDDVSGSDDVSDGGEASAGTGGG